MRSFDGLVTDEEAAKYMSSLPSPREFRRVIIERINSVLTLKGVRSVINEVALFQCVCSKKGCLLGALVTVRGERYWIHQNYVTDSPFISIGEFENGRGRVRLVESMADFVADSSRQELKRDSTLSTAWDPTGREVLHFFHISCRHVSTVVSPDFQSEIEQAKGKRNRALYV